MQIYVVFNHAGGLPADIVCFTSRKAAEKERTFRERRFLEWTEGKVNPDYDPDFICCTLGEFLDDCADAVSADEGVKQRCALTEAIALMLEK